MKLNLAQVRRSEGEIFSFKLEEEFPPLHIGADVLTYKEPVHVNLQVSNAGKSLLVQGTIDARLSAICGRCLEEFTYDINIPYDDEWVFAMQATEEQKENAFIFERDEVDITERITEQTVIALPMKYLCSDECRGLCPHCGKNLNLQSCGCAEEIIDPRLADLTKWRAGE